jgi:hypothetical protein
MTSQNTPPYFSHLQGVGGIYPFPFFGKKLEARKSNVGKLLSPTPFSGEGSGEGKT